MGLSFDQLFPGRFIKAGEMHDKPVTLTIERIFLETMEKEDGTEKPQAIVSFVEISRDWALNRTNASCLRAMWGDDTDAWIGKRVSLYKAPDTSGLAESGFTIRVKGSPDIPKTITAQVKLPRRRPVPMKLEKTSAGKDEHQEMVDDRVAAQAEMESEADFLDSLGEDEL